MVYRNTKLKESLQNHGADDSTQVKRHAIEMTVPKLPTYTNQMAADLRTP
jgi:hypothetical protein